VPARGKVLVDTDISMAVPAGTCMGIPPSLLFFFFQSIPPFPPQEKTRKLTKRSLTCYLDGRIAPRSGLASKHMIDTGAGVIDADYRGQVKVLLFNHGEADFEIKEGDRVAQLVLERIYTPEVVEVEELEESVRGAGGFGSTGLGI
jgi:dUTP pyrophosphatase